MRNRTVAILTVLCIVLSACAARQPRPTPTNPIDSIGRVLDAVNTTLNLATDFYDRQKRECAQQSDVCRFSPEALKVFRDRLKQANDSFAAALSAYEQARAGTGTVSEAQAKLEAALVQSNDVSALCGATCGAQQ